jgi:predicted transposase YbfD/YdcC
MAKSAKRSLVSFLETIPDPRVNRTKKHALTDIFAISLAATLSGAESFGAVHAFAVEQEDWLRTFLPLTHGIPSEDTIWRVHQLIHPKAFTACVADWLAEVCEATGLKHISLDGKSVRGAKGTTFTGRLHLVTAWATENGIVLGQEAVAEKSNEITAIPELLKTLDLAGTLVTIDAAGTQVEIARQIRAQGGDYLLPVKGNQPGLLAACEANFAAAVATDFADADVSGHESVEHAHGRTDERYTLALANPKGLPAAWAEAKVIVQVNRERTTRGRTAATTTYYLCSRRLAAKTLAKPIRRHWAIENDLHWTLDVTFREDDNRTRHRNAGANLGLIRRAAISLLKRVPGKTTLRTNRMRAAWNADFRLKVLQGFPEN